MAIQVVQTRDTADLIGLLTSDLLRETIHQVAEAMVEHPIVIPTVVALLVMIAWARETIVDQLVRTVGMIIVDQSRSMDLETGPMALWVLRHLVEDQIKIESPAPPLQVPRRLLQKTRPSQKRRLQALSTMRIRHEWPLSMTIALLRRKPPLLHRSKMRARIERFTIDRAQEPAVGMLHQRPQEINLSKNTRAIWHQLDHGMGD